MAMLAGAAPVLGVTAGPGVVAAPASPWPRGIALPAGVPVSEDYRRQFARCDRDGSFRGHVSRMTRGCRGDPNRVTALRRLPGGAIGYVSKLAVDLDGSAFACGPDHGRMDQCPTSLMLRGAGGREMPVDADRIPYVVIPDAGPADVAGEFARRTGVRVGDFGVVLARGRIVPVIVADTGPFAKLGEGSLALHRALGHEQCATGRARPACRDDDAGESIAGGIVTILFPGSARTGLTPRTIAAVTRRQGLAHWAAWRRRHGVESSISPKRGH